MTNPSYIEIKWVDGKREPKQKPDPRYLNGIDVIGHRKGESHCAVTLPYPAPRCGYYIVDCKRCNKSFAITTAGRVDDPRSATLACDRNKLQHH